MAEWEKNFDLVAHPWLQDHCPSFAIPVMPFAFMLAEIGAAGRQLTTLPRLIELRDAKVTSWLAFPEGSQRVRISAQVEESGDEQALVSVRLASFHRKMGDHEIFSPFCEGKALLAKRQIEADSAVLSDEPALGILAGSELYGQGYRFHGPAFRLIREVRRHNDNFWSAELEFPAENPVADDFFLPFLLDGLFQALPQEEWPEWHRSMGSRIGFPYRVSSAKFFGVEPQAGPFRAEIRFLGFETEQQAPRFHLRLFSQARGSWRMMAELTYQEYLVPLGKLFNRALPDRVAFLRDGRYVPDFSLSELRSGEARLNPEMIKQVDWLKGTAAKVYLESPELFQEYRRLDPRVAPYWLAERVALKELVGSSEGLHPREIQLEPAAEGQWKAKSPALPYQTHVLQSEVRDGEVWVRRGAAPSIELEAGLDRWRHRLGLHRSPVEILGGSLAEKFLGSVVLEDWRDFESLRGRPALFLANHQTFVESFMLNLVVGALTQVPVVFLAKHEHRAQWIGRFEEICRTYPGASEIKTIHFVDREDLQALFDVTKVLENYLVADRASVVIHVEGRRSYEAGDPVQKVSNVWLDMSVRTGVPVVPVRIVGGLPISNPERRKFDFPVGYGKQRFLIGRSISAASLSALPYAERLRKIKAELNRPVGALVEMPWPADVEFQKRVESFVRLSGATEAAAVVWAALERHWLSQVGSQGGAEFENPFDALIVAGRILLDSGRMPKLEAPTMLDSAWFENLLGWLFGGKLRVEIEDRVAGYRLLA